MKRTPREEAVPSPQSLTTTEPHHWRSQRAHLDGPSVDLVEGWPIIDTGDLGRVPAGDPSGFSDTGPRERLLFVGRFLGGP